MNSVNVENLRKQAKSLLKKVNAGDASSIVRARAGLPRLSDVADEDVPSSGATLQEMQHVIAIEQGFANWKAALAGAGVEGSRQRKHITHYFRPGLSSVRHEAERFLEMAHRGEGWVLDGIRKALPRVAMMSNEQIHQAGVTLEEVQQIVAADHGYPDWATLEAELAGQKPIDTFEDLVDLDDAELEVILFRLGRDRLAVALKSASDQLKARFQQSLSPEAWEALVAAMDELGPVALGQVELAQADVVAKFRTEDPMV